MQNSLQPIQVKESLEKNRQSLTVDGFILRIQKPKEKEKENKRKWSYRRYLSTFQRKANLSPKQIMTSEEKWIFSKNAKRRKCWLDLRQAWTSQAKQNLYERKDKKKKSRIITEEESWIYSENPKRKIF